MNLFRLTFTEPKPGTARSSTARSCRPCPAWKVLATKPAIRWKKLQNTARSPRWIISATRRRSARPTWIRWWSLASSPGCLRQISCHWQILWLCRDWEITTVTPYCGYPKIHSSNRQIAQFMVRCYHDRKCSAFADELHFRKWKKYNWACRTLMIKRTMAGRPKRPERKENYGIY